MIKKIVVFGANGFIGENFSEYIFDKKLINNFKFILVANKSTNSKKEGIEYELCDLTNYKSLTELLVLINPNFIINLAGVTGNFELDLCLQVNAEVPRKIMEIIIKNNLKVEKMLLIGSAAEYGANTNFPLSEKEELSSLNNYGLSKIIQTQYFNYFKDKINMNIARTFNVIGPHISNKLAIGSFIEKIKNCEDGGTIYTGDLSAQRDYLHIEDVLDAFMKILIEGKKGEIYNVCSGKCMSMREILDNLIEASEKSINVIEQEISSIPSNVSKSRGNNAKLISHVDWNQKIVLNETYDAFFKTK
jgi:GDP-4-dehydro-6-deoxy-D-mannose reductase